jgi:hypothetical protein
MKSLLTVIMFSIFFARFVSAQSFEPVVDVDHVSMSVSSTGCRSTFNIANSNAFGVDYKYTITTTIANGDQIPETWNGHLGAGKSTTFDKQYPSAPFPKCRVVRTAATMTITPTNY